MIPTSTNVTVELGKFIPKGVDAVAVFLPEKAGGVTDPSAMISEGEATAAGRMIELGLFRGKSREVAVTPAQTTWGDKRRVICVGLGEAAKVTRESLREAAGALAKTARKHRVRTLSVIVPSIREPREPIGFPAAIDSIASGLLLASFKYNEYKGAASKKKQQSEDGEGASPLHVRLVVREELLKELKPALDRAVAVADGQNFSRTIGFRPGNDINPPALAKVAQQLAKEAGLAIRVMDEKELRRLGMGGILAVGAGSSATPPRLIVLEYRPVGRGAPTGKKGAKRRARHASPLLVIGKAITFDTGGISIKPAEKMGNMIFDKCGGMAVLGLMYAVARLRPAIGVIGILSSAENHISETAYRPGDIVRMYNGVTVQVTNTDAEGRLVLGDALAWGIETYAPAAVLDLATLTGGVVVALGKTMAGVMSTSDGLCAELQRAADRAGEKIWRLPLGEDQREQIKSEPADIVNSAGRDAHPLQGGAFLSYFIPDGTPWAHLDIAGVADTEKELPYYGKGATGWGVRTLVEWVLARAGAPKA